MHRAAVAGDVEGVRVALEAGGDPSGVDAAGWHPLHFAAQAGGSQVAVLLLEAGAEVDAVDGEGSPIRSTQSADLARSVSQ